EIPGTVARSDVAGPVGDDKTRLLGGDRGFEGAQDGGGSGPGQTNYNGINGAIDFGPDHDETPQTSGREERNTQHAIHTDPGAAAHGGGENSGGHRSSDQASAPIVIAVQEASQKVAETAAQKAADKLQDAVDHQHGPSQNEPIKPHESATADIGHGSGSHADA